MISTGRVPSTDGVTVALHDFGGDGPALLIAHATGFCAGAYSPVAAALRPRFHVWGLDFRAHGDTTVPENGRLEWDGMVDDLLAVTDHLGEGTLHGFGHSMGGAVLLRAEALRPGTLASVFAFEPIVIPRGWTNEGGNHLADSALRRRAEFDSKAAALQRYASRPPLSVFRADALSAYVEHGFVELPDGRARLKCAPENESRIFGSQTIGPDEVADAKVPTIVAASGGGGPAAFAPFVVERVPNARLATYPRLTHFGPFEDPSLLADDTMAAIDAIGPI
jgi:pimeloyl-ACP methyl ester carboxylesterase